MSISLLERVQDRISVVCEEVNESQSELYFAAFMPLVYFSETISPNENMLKDDDIVNRVIQLLIHGCRTILTQKAAFLDSLLLQRCKLYVVELAKEVGLGEKSPTVIGWLTEINKPLPKA